MGRRLLVLVAIGLVVIACDGPTSPPPPPPPPPPPTVKAITINGRARIAPGETEAYEAIATKSDGSTQVYTSQVQWQSSSPGLLAIINNSGVATARAVGDVVVTASYLNLRATTSVIVVPTGTYRLTGKVLESGLPVLGALVKITPGQGSGLSIYTDVNGDYRFYGVAGPVDIEITKSGYTTITRSIVVSHDDSVDFADFRQTAGVASLAGTYTLTITIAADCQPSPPTAQFPEPRTRTYTAAVTQNGPALHVALSGADFLIQNGRGNAFDGRVEPTGVTFSLGSLGAYAYYYFYYTLGLPDVAEKISATEYLALLGKAFTTSSPSGLVGQLNGAAMLFTQPSPGGVSSVRVSCQSSRHQFSLTPQTAATRRR
jgi:Carboxypeptidase regulatory-like domain